MNEVITLLQKRLQTLSLLHSISELQYPIIYHTPILIMGNNRNQRIEIMQ
jgi:hypothetical protein